MHHLLDLLKGRDWDVRLSADAQTLLTAPVARRYPRLPANLVAFLSDLDKCCGPAGDVWFLTAADYDREEGDAFRWNEYEFMQLESATTEDERVEVRAFWDNHFPFMLATHSDYDYLALRVADDGFGQVVHGYAPYWSEPSVVAPSFEAFLIEFTAMANASGVDGPLLLFLKDGQTQQPR